MNKKRLSVIVCAYNERDTILTVLERIRAVEIDGWEKEIIVVDNHSTDGTRELLRTVDAPDTYIIYQPRNMGKGSSIRTAIQHLTGDYAVIHDADLEYDPEDHRKLVAEAEKGAIAVFGSRTLDGQANYEYAHAYLGVRLITATMNFLFGGNLTDAATAVKMVRSDVLKALNLVGSGFDLDFELPDKLLLAGIEIVEVPITYNPRTYEEGKKITVWDGLHAFLIMLRDRLGLSPVWKANRPALAASPPAERKR
ncbi:MAG TPA: glycosyltransferase family 2 protein [Chloroflexi bacterium]|nr:glycosyltransferase family 2 protein [Chloroflexota bacterium]